MDLHAIDYLTKGTLLGLAAGFSPGPLTFLVISETLRHGLRSGIQVALAPMVTDIPIILVSAVMLDRLLNHPGVFGVISVAGSIFLLHLGLGSLRSRTPRLEEVEVGSRSLKRGIAANLLNPNPYIFWISVGTPAIVGAMSVSAVHAAAFVVPFFVFIVGSKVLLSRLVHGSRSFLSSKAYLWTLRLLGVLLILYAVSVLREGLAHLGIGLL